MSLQAKDTTPLLRDYSDDPAPVPEKTRLPTSVLWCYAFAFLDILIQEAVAPILLLFIQYRGWGDKDNVTYFAIVTAVGSVVPVVYNPLTGVWASRRGYKEVMVCGSLIAMAGLLLMAEVKHRAVFALGSAFSFFLMSLRRTLYHSYIVVATTPEQRLRAMSWVALATSLGGVPGPGVVMLADLGPQPGKDKPYHWGQLRVNSYTLVFYTCALIVLGKIFATLMFFKPVRAALHRQDVNAKMEEKPWEGTFEMLEGGRRKVISTKRHVLWCLIFFSAWMFIMNLSVGFYMVCLHPLLVDKFNYDASDMARASFVICGLAVLPPLIMAAVSKKYSSRTILIAGMALKVFGCLLFAIPPYAKAPAHQQQWYLIVSYVLILKGLIFVITAALTLFSQLMGKRNSSTFMGIITGFYALGTAIGNLVGGKTLLPLYGKWHFVLLAAGALFSFLILLYPPVYRLLDPDSERVRLLNLPEPPRIAVQNHDETKQRVAPI